MDSEFPAFLGTPTPREGEMLDLVVAVAEAVGDVTDRRPVSITDPLFETVDLELLHGLLASMQGGNPVDGSVRFETDDVTVIVDTDGTVTAQTDHSTAHRQFPCPPADPHRNGGNTPHDS